MGALAVLFSLVSLFSQNNRFAAVGLDDILAAPLSSAKINGSANAANRLPAGAIVVFKTDEGRYGKFIVQTYGEELILDYVTYHRDGSIFDQCRDLIIRANWYADLDIGVECERGKFCDFLWEQARETERYLIPQNGAEMAVYRFPDYMCVLNNGPSLVQPGQALAPLLEVEVREVVPGIPGKKIAVDLVLLSRGAYPSPAPLAVYAPQYQDKVLLKGGRAFIQAGYGTTTVVFDGPLTIPENTPPGLYYLAAVADAGDVVMESDERNNVALAGIWVDKEDYFGTISVDAIRQIPMTSDPLNGNAGRFNQLSAGTVLAYQTNEGRYGKLLIKSHGYDLLADWVTFNPDGSVYARGNNLLIQAAYLYDLDRGREGSGADLWWEIGMYGERLLVPKNGAAFAVYPRDTAM